MPRWVLYARMYTARPGEPLDAIEIGRVVASSAVIALSWARLAAARQMQTCAGYEVRLDKPGAKTLNELLEEQRNAGHKSCWCNIKRKGGRPSRATEDSRRRAREEDGAHGVTFEEYSEDDAFDEQYAHPYFCQR